MWDNMFNDLATIIMQWIDNVYTVQSSHLQRIVCISTLNTESKFYGLSGRADYVNVHIFR